MAKLTDRLVHAWNAFSSKEEIFDNPAWGVSESSYGGRINRSFRRISSERSIVASIYTRLAIDVAAIGIRHIRMDEAERYIDTIDSDLNQCLTVSANIDQAARAFRQDMTQTMLEEGVIAVVPVTTSLNPNRTGSFDIKDMRVGTITEWFPSKVRVNLYNDEKGVHQEVVLDKSYVAIVENPLYSVMNEPNSTLQRLARKLNLLDVVDENSSSGKLDIMIQLPYVIKSEAKRQQAEQRRKDLEMQLKGSQYGIAYTDGSEKITQLNRPAENNLLRQVEYLTGMLYAQLGLTEEVMNGTADEATMLNYYNRTIEPILDSIVEEMRRKFLTKTARTQLQSIAYFRDPFKLVPISVIAEMADKFTRNEILSSNEVRSIVGLRPSKDPDADRLKNSNMPDPKEPETPKPTNEKEGDIQNEGKL